MAHTTRPLRSVCVLGGGTAGWMTAAALAAKFGESDLSVTLVESEAIGTVGVGEATLPHIRFFNEGLGIREADFMKATNATYKLGIEFCDWFRIGESYIHPFGEFGTPLKGIDFHHVWTRLRNEGRNENLGQYSYPVEMAYAGGFHHPHPDMSRVEASFGYAYQFDSTLYAKLLRQYSEERGIKRREGRVVDVKVDSQSGFVKHLMLEDGGQVSADLFIDCSGFRGMLIEGVCRSGYQNWQDYLPCDRALAVQSERTTDPVPYTRATARSAGWQWRIPLQHRNGNGYVYCSNFIDEDNARAELLSHIDGKTLKDPHALRFTTGRRNHFFQRNVVAIGLSGGFLEPLESTSIHFIQEGITALLELFPDTSFSETDRAEYDARMALNFERVRDFLLLHYVATEREDSAFWRHFRNLELPDSLREKMEAWDLRGRVPTYEHSVFLPPSWIAVFAGQGRLPKHADPRLAGLSPDDVIKHADDLRRSIQSAVKQAPSHSNALANPSSSAQFRAV